MSGFNSNVIVVQSLCLKHLFTKIRDVSTPRVDYVRYSKRIMRIVCEEGLACVNPVPVTVITPTGSEYQGSSVDVWNMVAVSIIRSADAMLGTLSSDSNLYIQY
jgi:uracil phosphoribosyltransferase